MRNERIPFDIYSYLNGYEEHLRQMANMQQQYTQTIANAQFNAYMGPKQPSEYDKRLLEVRQKQYNIRRKTWSILK